MRLTLMMVAGLAAGCGGGEVGVGGATQSEIADCRDSCNQLKFFDCNDALDHAACFQNCDAASTPQIELFTACVGADICDPACSTHIRPPAPPPRPPADQCTPQCQTYLGEGCMPDVPPAACAQLCAEDAALATYCLQNRSGCALPAGCMAEPPDPADDCRQGCESQARFNCITPTDAAECATRCATADQTTLASFMSCTSAGICQDDQCYRILNPTGGSADVPGCRQACDDLAFFDCVNPATQATCRDLCAEASAPAVDNFKACAQGVCDGDACWRLFLEATGS